MTGIKYPLLGELIDYLIKHWMVQEHWTMAHTMDQVAELTHFAKPTIHHWRQGLACPADPTLATLARLGQRIGLDRHWGTNLLHAARHPDAAPLVVAIWGPELLKRVPNNLPALAARPLVGRTAELAALLELLQPQFAPLITVDGVGGVGKTELVITALHRCLAAGMGALHDPSVPKFAAIIFTTAKQQTLTGEGLLIHQQARRTLRDIFRDIAQVLDRPEITHAAPEDQDRLVRDLLHQFKGRLCLIVDNLETLENRQAIMGFLYHLPPHVKVIVTTRERVLIYTPIQLRGLAEVDAWALLAHEADGKGVRLTEEDIQTLLEKVGGVPAALLYAVGQRAAGYSLATTLTRIYHAPGDVARFCFVESVAPLRDSPAHHLLMALALFPQSPTRIALAAAAGLSADPLAVEEGLAQLQKLSLVTQHEERYSVLPLTREYALAELATQPLFAATARERWVQWYLDYTAQHGGQESKEWQIHYDRLAEEWGNIQAVLNWCAAQDNYEAMRDFWSDARLRSCANIYGYWDDRLLWLDWLQAAAERRGDWEIAVRAAMESGWTYALIGAEHSLAKADQLLAYAGSHQQQALPDTCVDVTRNTAILRIRQRRYADAVTCLTQGAAVLKYISVDSNKNRRDEISHSYYRAEVHFHCEEYAQAEDLYRQVMAQAQAIGWQRAGIYAQNWLADIAILQGRWAEAETLLQSGMAVAERNKDKRRLAFYRYSLARLEQQRGNPALMLQWAHAARDLFERLGMAPEATQIAQLIAAADGRG